MSDSKVFLTFETAEDQRLAERALLQAAHEKEMACGSQGIDAERAKLLADAGRLRKMAARIQL